MAIQVLTPRFHVEECLEEIRECLEIGWTGMGFKTLAFEEEWKKYTGMPNAYYLNSATAGLNMAVELMKMEYGWADGDEIISTPLTFVSTNHAILLAGMNAVFADVDETMCLDPKSVEERITQKTRAVIYVGVGGNVGNYEQIVDICKRHGLRLILDAAHMSGTLLNGQVPGKEADVAVYSFQAVKNLPTADSGMICWMDSHLDAVSRQYAWLGINKDTYSRVGKEGNYKWKYSVDYVGNKLHGNSVIASIGLVQLKYLDEDNAYRRQLAQWYKDGLSKFGDKIKYVKIAEGCLSSTHLFQIIVENRDELLSFLNENDIFPGVHYIDNTKYRMYSHMDGSCPKSAYYSERLLSLPLHLRLTKEDVDYVVEVIGKFINERN